MNVYDDLCDAAKSAGIKLFTVTLHDPGHAQVRRAYSSDPVAYPVSGTKPLSDDAWSQQVIGRGEAFVANHDSGFKDLFPDHAQIVALGCRSCANLPILRKGEVVGTLNLLAEAGHFTPARLAGYQAMLAAHHDALLAEIAARPLG
ncbi:GAF domain-containing protein [Pseudorhodobacter sp. E13]|nr:GAF domain-containing protein [Pseudorhodobacter sp. E13]